MGGLGGWRPEAGPSSAGGCRHGPSPAARGLAYLDSLLMTLMRAPFSSFSLWLSDFSSVRTCGAEEDA